MNPNSPESQSAAGRPDFNRAVDGALPDFDDASLVPTHRDPRIVIPPPVPNKRTGEPVMRTASPPMGGQSGFALGVVFMGVVTVASIAALLFAL